MILREESNIVKNVLQGFDLLVVIFSFVTAYFLKKYYLPIEYRGIATAPNYYFVLLLALVVSHIIFNYFKFYEALSSLYRNQIIIRTLKGIAASFAILIIILYLLHTSNISRIMMGLYVMIEAVMLICSKIIISNVLKKLRKKGVITRKVLIVGCKERAKEVIKTISKSPPRIAGTFEHPDADHIKSVQKKIDRYKPQQYHTGCTNRGIALG